MAVPLMDTDIHESHCRRLLLIYRPPSHESRNRPHLPSPFHPIPPLVDGFCLLVSCPGISPSARQQLASHFPLLLCMKIAVATPGVCLVRACEPCLIVFLCAPCSNPCFALSLFRAAACGPGPRFRHSRPRAASLQGIHTRWRKDLDRHRHHPG